MLNIVFSSSLSSRKNVRVASVFVYKTVNITVRRLVLSGRLCETCARPAVRTVHRGLCLDGRIGGEEDQRPELFIVTWRRVEYIVLFRFTSRVELS